MVKKTIELVGLWWAEAGRYNVLPLDDRFQERSLARESLASTRTKFTFYPGAVRIPEHVAPNTMNRSWAVEAIVEIPKRRRRRADRGHGRRHQRLVALPQGGQADVLLQPRRHRAHLHPRRRSAIAPGPHVVRYEFEKRGKEPFGAGGVGRIFVDGQKVAEGEIPTTAAFGYSLDETFDIGCDKGAPVTDEYRALASFTRHDRQGRRRSEARTSPATRRATRRSSSRRPCCANRRKAFRAAMERRRPELDPCRAQGVFARALLSSRRGAIAASARTIVT